MQTQDELKTEEKGDENAKRKSRHNNTRICNHANQSINHSFIHSFKLIGLCIVPI